MLPFTVNYTPYAKRLLVLILVHLICDSEDVARKRENQLVGRWNCHNCLSSFKVTSGTIFEKTQTPLTKWFAAIAILLNAKKSVSSCQLARDLDLSQKTAWRIAHKIRAAMKADTEMMRGVVEADETYIGGRGGGRQWRKHKKAVLGVVERGGDVRAIPAPHVTTKLINMFLSRNIDPRAMLVTDYWRGYNETDDWIHH